MILDLALVCLSLPVLGCATYLLVLTLASGRTKPPPRDARTVCFDVIVPAHDEEAGVARTVRSLLAVDYPRAFRRVWVVADNCSDATARCASEAGAHVLVRNDPDRGKGRALAFAFAHALRDGFAEAVVVVDADTSVSPNLLRAFARRLRAGALAVQADYGVRNAGASWRTQLMALAFALFHGVRSRGRAHLGLSVGLRGNGMALATRALRAVPYRAHGLAEDVEYGLELGKAGIPVAYAPEARVEGDMPSTGSTARSQRARWERGREDLAAAHAKALVAGAVRRRSWLLADLALDLMVPPLATIVGASLLGLLVSVAIALVEATRERTSIGWVPWAASLGFLVAHVSRGWMLARLGRRGLVALCMTPVYAAWKLCGAIHAHPDVWVRTRREAP